MGTLVITNLTAEDVSIGDWYPGIVPASSSITLTRSPADLSGMSRLGAAAEAGTVSYSFTRSAEELLLGGDETVPVPAATLLSGIEVLRKPFTALAAGTADDVTVYAVDTLPAKCRVINAWAVVATAIGASTVTIRDEAAGAGTAYGALSSGSTGYAPLTTTPTATAVLTPGATKGLFLRRSDRGVAGEVFIMIRREV